MVRLPVLSKSSLALALSLWRGILREFLVILPSEAVPASLFDGYIVSPQLEI